MTAVLSSKIKRSQHFILIINQIHAEANKATLLNNLSRQTDFKIQMIIMKNLLFIAALLTVGFVACDTPSPTTTNPSDSTTNSNSTTDTTGTKTDTTRTQ
jgi:hypothetical protein